MKKFLPLIVLLIFTGCSSITVKSDYDKEADFTRYDTFMILPWSDESKKLVNELNRLRISNAIKTEMEGKGLKYVQTDADVAIASHVVFQEKSGITSYNNYYGMGYGAGYYYGGWGWGMGYVSTTYEQFDYIQGTLIVDVFDAGSKGLVWQGVGQGTVNEKTKGRENRINAAIKMIMKRYPEKK